MVVRNLEFFDKDGYNLNLNWNEQRQIWEGNVFFPKVSVGLYENTTIYVVEYVGQNGNSDSDYTDDVYSYPMGEGNIVFQWELYSLNQCKKYWNFLLSYSILVQLLCTLTAHKVYRL